MARGSANDTAAHAALDRCLTIAAGRHRGDVTGALACRAIQRADRAPAVKDPMAALARDVHVGEDVCDGSVGVGAFARAALPVRVVTNWALISATVTIGPATLATPLSQHIEAVRTRFRAAGRGRRCAHWSMLVAPLRLQAAHAGSAGKQSVLAFVASGPAATACHHENPCARKSSGP